MKKHTEVTIYDLARKLNLATSTISRALNGHYSISQPTVEKVKKKLKRSLLWQYLCWSFRDLRPVESRVLCEFFNQLFYEIANVALSHPYHLGILLLLDPRYR